MLSEKCILCIYNTISPVAWSLASYNQPVTFFVAQLIRHSPEHFDVGLRSCAKNQVVTA